MTTDLALESSGRRLAGRLTRPAEPSGRALLFIHGLHSTQAGYGPRAAAAAEALGAISLTFDLGGHGSSEGDGQAITPRENLADAVVAYDALAATEGVDGARIGVCGASYGGYLAALLTARRDVARLLMRAPALYEDERLDLPLGARGAMPAAPPAQATKALADFRGEVLVLESEHDEVIPHAMIEAYLAAGGHVHHAVLHGIGHRLADAAAEAAFVERLLDWFRPL
jgi:dipeptidyl aminopeptidase/acylaminoacyl peptidase